jgi:peptidoglycan/LPS O-acetylase OafA/YrhL
MKLDTGTASRPPQDGSDATRARSRGDHFAGFDGLRAIAALTVVGVHTAFASGFTSQHHTLGRYTSRLEIGVSVFFVISGFLLYRPFAVDHFGGRAAPPRRTFWTRRVKRIVPAYWVAFLIVSYILHDDQVRHSWEAPFIYLGFAQIYFPHYIITGIDQAWSLCTEMSFYLLLPLYAALLGRRRRDPDRQFRVEGVGLAALVAVSLAYRIPVLLAAPTGPAAAHPHLTQAMPSWLPGYLDQFALGMLLAVVSAYLVAVDRRPSALWHPATPWISWTLAVAAFVWVSNIGLSVRPLDAASIGPSLLRQTLYGVFGFFLVMPAVFGPQDYGALRRFLTWRPIALIGVVSYGVYLWHEAWMYTFLSWFGPGLFHYPWGAMLALVTILAVTAATLSYRLVERPVLRYHRSGAVRGGPVRPAIPLVGARP